VYAALRAGASGFLLKHSTPDELAAAVRVVAAGDALLAPSVTRRLVEDFARVQPVVPITPVHLTPRETDVLRQVARGLSNRQIAAELVLAEQTVKTHVSNVLTKLDLRDRAQAVVYAYEAGVVTPGPRH
jgi:DNA-binding NarL/FixJ family response regulator